MPFSKPSRPLSTRTNQTRRRTNPMPKPLTITTPGDRQIVVVREFDAPRDLVFLSYSKPELMRRWYGMPDWTSIVCDIDFRVCGKYRVGQRSPEGYELASQGVYTAIVAPELIEQTEYYDDDWTQGGTVNVLTLTEAYGVILVFLFFFFLLV